MEIVGEEESEREGEGSGNPEFSPHISYMLVNVRLHTENYLSNLPESVLEVCLGGGWWWWVVYNVNLVNDSG